MPAALAGWVARAGRSTASLGWLVPPVQRAASTRPPSVYTRIVGGLLRVSVAGPARLRRPARPDLLRRSPTRPTGFIPPQDKGYLLVNVQLPDAASLERTAGGDAADRGDRARRSPGVKHTVGDRRASRSCSNANASNFGAMYVMLDDFHHRAEPELLGRRDRRASCRTTLQRGDPRGRWSTSSAPRRSRAWARPAASRSSIEDRGDTGLDALAGRRRPGRRRRRATTPSLQGLFTSFRANTPWLYLDIDRDAGQDRWACRSTSVFNTLQVYLGSLYVNDFNRFGRTWQVNVQARRQLPQAGRGPQAAQGPQRAGRDGAARRASPASRDVSGPVMIMRYNMYPVGRRSTATPAPGVSSGQAIDAMETVADDELPPVDAAEWTELALLAAADRQHRHAACSCWPWCWCSWCWRRSTRAGRCRWR